MVTCHKIRKSVGLQPTGIARSGSTLFGMLWLSRGSHGRPFVWRPFATGTSPPQRGTGSRPIQLFCSRAEARDGIVTWQTERIEFAGVFLGEEGFVIRGIEERIARSSVNPPPGNRWT